MTKEHSFFRTKSAVLRVKLHAYPPYGLEGFFNVSKNLSISWVVDETAWIFKSLGRPMIPLYGDGDLKIIKFIKGYVECSPSPKDTISRQHTPPDSSRLLLEGFIRKVHTHPSTTIMFLNHDWVREPVGSVTIPPSTGNLSISWAVYETAWIFKSLGRPMIPLYGEGDLKIIKFIKGYVECSPSPKDTISNVCPNSQDISPLNPGSGVVAGVIRLFTSKQSLLKQCSCNTSEADPPSTNMWWIRCPSTFASITIGFFCSSLFAGGWTMKIAMDFSLLEVSPFLVEAFVTLIILSMDLGMLSFSLLIKSGALDVFLLLREISKKCFPQDLIAIYGLWWEFVEPDSSRTNQCGVKRVAPCGHDPSLDFAAVWKILSGLVWPLYILVWRKHSYSARDVYPSMTGLDFLFFLDLLFLSHDLTLKAGFLPVSVSFDASFHHRLVAFAHLGAFLCEPSPP
nr:hypothetical protein [Tanacetum cinerariifolium]